MAGQMVVSFSVPSVQNIPRYSLILLGEKTQTYAV